MPTQWYDGQSDQLSDMIGSDPADNTVGSLHDQIYPTTDSSISEDSTPLSLLKSGTAAIAKSAKSESQSPLGSIYGSPVSWINHIMGVANYFKGDAKGNEYTDNIKKPQQQEPLKAVDPNSFYSKWYESMRRFSEAEEVASRGQTQVRSR